jgi:hypothetical protein
VARSVELDSYFRVLSTYTAFSATDSFSVMPSGARTWLDWSAKKTAKGCIMGSRIGCAWNVCIRRHDLVTSVVVFSVATVSEHGSISWMDGAFAFYRRIYAIGM